MGEQQWRVLVCSQCAMPRHATPYIALLRRAVLAPGAGARSWGSLAPDLHKELPVRNGLKLATSQLILKSWAVMVGGRRTCCTERQRREGVSEMAWTTMSN